MLWATILMSFREIRRNTMRSLLTTLGIVIGVSAVITLVTLGQGATAKVTADVAKMGNNMIMLMPGADRRGPTQTTATPFKAADVVAIQREIASVQNVAPSSGKSQLLVFGNKNHAATVTGTTNDYFAIRGYSIEKGRLFTDAETGGGQPACVIGDTVRKELFGSGDPLGAFIRVGNVSCRVIGTLQSKGQSTFGIDQDDFVVMPLKTFQRRISGSIDIGSILISAKSESLITKTKTQVSGLMRERRRTNGGEDDFTVRDTKEIADTLSSVTGALTALLGAIAAVSLLVGGIGIMNIMLVSVTERTREIGVRLAIGARAEEVLLQFLIEAVVLSLFGGVAGMLLGLFGSYFGAKAMSMPFLVSPQIVVVALVFSAAIGVGFGYAPARKAAALNPIDALRHE
ncbi:MAG: ABC transporter permease [Polyangiaceae bacterium]